MNFVIACFLEKYINCTDDRLLLISHYQICSNALGSSIYWTNAALWVGAFLLIKCETKGFYRNPGHVGNCLDYVLAICRKNCPVSFFTIQSMHKIKSLEFFAYLRIFLKPQWLVEVAANKSSVYCGQAKSLTLSIEMKC